LYVKDEFELLKTLYISIEITFRHKRYRVQLGKMMQFAKITSNRSNTLLAICYRHIKITLLLDFNDEKQFRMLIEIIFLNTKDYLEKKDK